MDRDRDTKMQFHNPAGLPVHHLEQGYLIECPQPHIIRKENNKSNLDEVLQIIVAYCSDPRSWQEVIDDYRADISHVLEPVSCSHLSALPRQLSSGVKAIQDNFSYHAVAFGARGYIPRDVETIFQSQNGDCKDHSIALYHYLKQLGLEPRLALVSEWRTISKELPSIAQFDHMVVALPDPAMKWRIIDGTVKNHPLMDRVPYELIGYHCLILDDEQHDWVKITPEMAGERQIKRSIEIQIHEDGSAEVSEQVMLSEVTADYFRRSLANKDADKQKHTLQRLIGASNLDLRNIAVSGLDHHEPHLELAFTYARDFFAHRHQNQTTVVLPSHWRTEEIAISPKHDRQYPYRLYTGLDETISYRIQYPTSWQLTTSIPDMTITNKFVSHRIKRSYELDSHALDIRTETKIHAGLYQPQEFHSFARNAAEILFYHHQPITWTTE